jgi:hypothetical protein
MVTSNRLAKLTKDLECAVDMTKRIFAIAPDIIPSSLEAFVFLPQDKVSDQLLKVINDASEDKKESICNALEQAAVQFQATVTDMENRIKARQQPSDLPRRESARPFKQFKQRKSEW